MRIFLALRRVLPFPSAAIMSVRGLLRLKLRLRLWLLLEDCSSRLSAPCRDCADVHGLEEHLGLENMYI